MSVSGNSARHFRPETGSIPVEPGVYRFLDEHGQVLYVGKARNLRSRLNSYFGDPAGMHRRTAAMVAAAADVDWTVVGTEVEALQLEFSWIKEFEPRFNVKYTDDKSYPFLAITMAEEFPRVTVMRGAKRKGVRYFGPYSHAWAIRETVDQLLRVFPARTCSKGVFRRAAAAQRPCLLGHIGKCSAPCVGRVTPEEHREIVNGFAAFVAGGGESMMKDIERGMKRAAADQDYETAARLRDDYFAMKRALERNAVVLPERTEADLFALVADELQGAVQIFHVRGGRITGQRGLILDRTLDLDDSELIEQALLRQYGDAEEADIPTEILVTHEPPGEASLASWLRKRRGAKVRIRQPRRGAKRALMETVERNAEQSLNLHKRRRVGDLTARARALEDLQQALGLASAPLRLEGYDISTLQGQDTVGSMVVFEDGMPRTSDYRRFTVSNDNASSDTAALAEVLTRRFRRYLSERAEASDIELDLSDESSGPTKRRSFAYPPQLVVVDGAGAQAAAAQRALEELGIDDIAVCGLAKRLEEIWLPGSKEPVILSRSSEALHLLQHLRDEAHRFAIAGHRNRRTARARVSALDGIPGLGPAKRKALLRQLGSVKRIRAASAAELAEVPGIGPVLAESILVHLHSDSEQPAPAANLSTGEIIDPNPQETDGRQS